MVDQRIRKETVESILQTFPFRRQRNQRDKLYDYFLSVPGANKTAIQEQTGISQPTIRAIQRAYSRLDKDQRIALIVYLLSTDLE